MDVLNFANYGQKRERIATEGEMDMFDILKEMAGKDDIELVRKCDDYVTAEWKGWDLARLKYTPRAKWICFPVVELGGTKNRINAPSDIVVFQEAVDRSVAHILKYTD